MPKSCGDPTIHELLDDPLTQAVMRADRVDPLALRRILERVALEVQDPARQPDYEPRWLAAAFAQARIAQWARSQHCGEC